MTVYYCEVTLSARSPASPSTIASLATRPTSPLPPSPIRCEDDEDEDLMMIHFLIINGNNYHAVELINLPIMHVFA